MTRKKVIVEADTEKIEEPRDYTAIHELLAPFVDPTDDRVVLVRGRHVIINSTQVSRAVISQIIDVVGEDWMVVTMACHPSQCPVSIAPLDGILPEAL